MPRGRYLLIAAAAAGLLMVTFGVASAAGMLSPTETQSSSARLGKAIFFDQNLSLNRNLSCASCHDAAVGFTGPLSKINLHGYFKSLEAIVHFYNTRDVLARCPGPYTEAQALRANCWPAPEVAANVDTVQLGNLGLSPSEEAAIVAYLRTLSDGYRR
jgi:cytochrome c peroxidase